MSVRAKFKCVSVSPENSGSIKLQPVYYGSKENEEFFNATPYGEISLNIVNKPAAEYFEIGKEYYVDFTAAE